LIDKTDPKILKELETKKGQNRFRYIVEACSKNKKCIYNNGCMALQPTKYSRVKESNNFIKLYAEFAQGTFKDSTKASNQQQFTPLVCYKIFKKIKDEDVDFIGLSSKYSRPEWMIITSLAVPPPAVRPSIRQSDNQRSEDDLTFGLAMIIKSNKLLKNFMDNSSANMKNIENYHGLLQYHVSTYMDNEIPGLDPAGHRSTFRPLKAITQRLKGKEGRLRINIMGKRVDYSARTVISVDPNIDIDEFGVPLKIAMNLTFPEVVNKFNIEKLRKIVLNGPKTYPGAKTVAKGDLGNQRSISLKHVDVQKVANELEIGDIVHRHLLDDDPCLFNRQPTLHKMSMMTHRIKVLPFSTFRLNVTVCKPYNADFDGDEMNMHIPQSIQTQVELDKICAVRENIISPGNSKPSLEITQDTLVGAYLLTIKNIKLSKQMMNNYMMFMKNYNGQLPEPEEYIKNVPYWSGKQLFSLILPNININQLKNVEIIHGHVTKGYLNDESLGGNPAGLIKQIYNAYGTNECVNFLNNTQKLITRWMMDHSFSISFGDSILNKKQRSDVIEIANKYIAEIYELIKMAQHGTFANDLDDSLKFLKLEGDISNLLSKIDNECGEYITNFLKKTNNFYIAGNKGAGSKGKLQNLIQIMACVGPQLVWGTRIRNGFTDRTLPHFYRNDIGPDAKGFCRNSYIQGLTPSELFFHAMGGRCGSIDTAIQTADSGYISRKLIKAAEDLMINYDMTVRNATNNIIQFAYGDDNMDPTKLEKVNKIDLIEKNNDEIEQMYKFDDLDNKAYFETFMTKEAVEKMFEEANYKSYINLEFKEILDNRNILRTKYFKYTEAIGDIKTFVPINLFRVMASQILKFNIQKYDLSDLTPQYIIDEYEKVMLSLVKYLPEKNENWKLFKIIFKSFISSKRILKEYRLNKIAFDDLLLLIKNKMLEALVSPGEMVGIIGAQTLGEISTQLTLNSVTYETEIVVRDQEKNIMKVKIGDFIHKEIEKSEKINFDKEKDTTYAECKEYYEVPNADINGNTVWNKIEAVTKHPVINEDGTNTMLKITTYNNREVIATKAKSFLQLIDGKIQETSGSELKVGDYLPVSKKELDYNQKYYLDLKELLPPTEYIYGSELNKAKNVMNEYHWWVKHANKTFVLPHKRSDTVVNLISNKIRKGCEQKLEIKNNCIYTFYNSSSDYQIPENIKLDYNFGYLVGAYAAEGCMTKNQISISNNNNNYLRPIEELCMNYNINYKIYTKNDKNEKGWTSQDIRIYNTLLCRLLEKLCGKLSHNKFIHDKIVFSNKECAKGFLDAYIGGDGTIHRRKQPNGSYKYENASITSTSLNMLLDVSIMLKNFNIIGQLRKFKKVETNNRNSKNIHQSYQLYINNKQSTKLASLLHMKDENKQAKLIELSKRDFKFEISDFDEKVPNIINNETIMEERDNRFQDIMFDKIVSIEEVSNTTDYAYDLTVENTRNFDIYNGICMRDTFHLAGTGAASLVITDALPRLKEIIRLTKNLKNRNMTIYLKDEYANNKENAKLIKPKFTFTQIKDLLESSEILYDDKSGNTSNKEDMEFIQSYKEFTELFEVDNIDENLLSQWILRLKFDKENLMNRNITIQEIQEAIKESSHNPDEIDCIYSDDSAQDVIMRIKIKNENTENFLDFMKDFEKQLTEFPLRGIPDIEHVEVNESNIIQYNIDGSFNPTKEYVLKTNGSNLLEILSNDVVDPTRTFTNDIIEFHEVFGIEATRELIYREITNVFDDDKKPNPRHVQMLADIMCYRGILMQIERHGLNRNPEIGPIAKASFEEVMTILTQAAVFGEKENMKGVSANILAGQFCKSGTNCFEILMDEEKLLEKMEYNTLINNDIEEPTKEKIDQLFDQVYDKKETYQDINDNMFEFGFGMENNEEYMLSKNEDSHVKIVKSTKGSKENTIINVNNIDEIILDEINNETEENEKDNINNLTLDEIEDENNNESKIENQENNVIDDLSLEEIKNQDNITLNVETTIEEKPKKRGRPKKIL
jgi:DNA-directed RNA polymerase beta' subunit